MRIDRTGYKEVDESLQFQADPSYKRGLVDLRKIREQAYEKQNHRMNAQTFEQARAGRRVNIRWIPKSDPKEDENMSVEIRRNNVARQAAGHPGNMDSMADTTGEQTDKNTKVVGKVAAAVAGVTGAAVTLAASRAAWDAMGQPTLGEVISNFQNNQQTEVTPQDPNSVNPLDATPTPTAGVTETTQPTNVIVVPDETNPAIATVYPTIGSVATEEETVEATTEVITATDLSQERIKDLKDGVTFTYQGVIFEIGTNLPNVDITSLDATAFISRMDELGIIHRDGNLSDAGSGNIHRVEFRKNGDNKAPVMYIDDNFQISHTQPIKHGNETTSVVYYTDETFNLLMEVTGDPDIPSVVMTEDALNAFVWNYFNIEKVIKPYQWFNDQFGGRIKDLRVTVSE